MWFVILLTVLCIICIGLAVYLEKQDDETLNNKSYLFGWISVAIIVIMIIYFACIVDNPECWIYK